MMPSRCSRCSIISSSYASAHGAHHTVHSFARCLPHPPSADEAAIRLEVGAFAGVTPTPFSGEKSELSDDFHGMSSDVHDDWYLGLDPCEYESFHPQYFLPHDLDRTAGQILYHTTFFPFLHDRHFVVPVYYVCAIE